MWLALSRSGGTTTTVFPNGKSAHTVFERDLAKVLADPALRRQLELIGITPTHRITSHSTRKGAATTLASADCTGGFLVAICRRGDWAITTVLDSYLKCTIGGDQTLGRILAGMDPNGAAFDILPPHFLTGNDALVQEAMEEIWGTRETGIHRTDDGRYAPLLQRLLASLVYHHAFFVLCADRFDDEAMARGAIVEQVPLQQVNDLSEQTIQVVFPSRRLATYNEAQCTLIKNESIRGLLTRGSTLLRDQVLSTTIYDVRGDIHVEEFRIKVSIKLSPAVSRMEVHQIRDAILRNPIRIIIEETSLTSIGTLLRKCSRMNIALPRGHRCMQLAIYQNRDLLTRLKAVITDQPSTVIQQATGVPGFVHLRKDFLGFANRVDGQMGTMVQELKVVSTAITRIATAIETHHDHVATSVISKIDGELGERAWQAGLVTSQNLRRVLTTELETRDARIVQGMQAIHGLLRAVGERQEAARGDQPAPFDFHFEEDEVPPANPRDEGGAEPPAPAPAPAPHVRVDNWPRDGHFHERLGESFATPVNFAIPKTLTLRATTHYYMNGDSNLKMKPFARMTRKHVVTKVEKDRLSLMHRFFNRVRLDVLVPAGAYAIARRQTRVSRAEIDGLVDNIVAMVHRPPYSFIAKIHGRLRNGFQGAADEVQEGTIACTFSTLATLIDCSRVLRHGSDEDKAELVRRRGCGRDNGGKQCKSCRAYLATMDAAANENA